VIDSRDRRDRLSFDPLWAQAGEFLLGPAVLLRRSEYPPPQLPNKLAVALVMTRLSMILLAVALVAPLLDASRAPAADVEAGKATAEGCAGCHGEDGISQTPLTASLAGEPDDFTQWQLVYFRGGGRKSEVMGPIAEALDNQQIRNLGAYYASLAPPQPQSASAPDALAQTGAMLAVQHRCKSCHGDDYAGVGPAARLAGQREDVLLKALRDFKSGARVGSGVASMADVTYELGDADMQALAHYMATRP
jgi:cytochrome c553